MLDISHLRPADIDRLEALIDEQLVRLTSPLGGAHPTDVEQAMRLITAAPELVGRVWLEGVCYVFLRPQATADSIGGLEVALTLYRTDNV